MSPRFEEILVFVVSSIQVALFGWIHLRDRRKKSRLWLFGWIAIFVHFAFPAFDDWIPEIKPYTIWVRVATLIVCGTCFLLSVSEVFAARRRRLAFVAFITSISLLYLTALVMNLHQPWFYAGLLLFSNLYALLQAVRFYGFKSPYLYLLCLMLPYGGFAIARALHGQFDDGMTFYLCGFFAVTGLIYFRHFHRFTPGVIFTSISFVAWGSVFPLASYLLERHIGPNEQSFFWDLPKFFVAFGMILTLFEDEAEIAKTTARKYLALF